MTLEKSEGTVSGTDGGPQSPHGRPVSRNGDVLVHDTGTREVTSEGVTGDSYRRVTGPGRCTGQTRIGLV